MKIWICLLYYWPLFNILFINLLHLLILCYVIETLPPPPPPTTASAPQTPTVAMPSVPTTVTMPQPAAAPVTHHHVPTALDSNLSLGGHAAMRTDSPAVATSANAAVAPSPGHYHHPTYQHQPLYAPYASTTVAPYTTAASPYTTAAPTTVVQPVNSATTPLQQPTLPVKTSTAHAEREKQMVPPSPRGPSPVRDNRERESYR